VTLLEDSGELERLSALAIDDDRAYYLCQRAGGELSPEGMNLHEWIKGNLGDGQ
jgi:hypothetical protein